MVGHHPPMERSAASEPKKPRSAESNRQFGFPIRPSQPVADRTDGINVRSNRAREELLQGGPSQSPLTFGMIRMLPTIVPDRPKPRTTDVFRCETARSNYTPNHLSAQFAQASLLIKFALVHPSFLLTASLSTDRKVGFEWATALKWTVAGVQAGENKSTPTYQLPVRGN